MLCGVVLDRTFGANIAVAITASCVAARKWWMILVGSTGSALVTIMTRCQFALIAKDRQALDTERCLNGAAIVCYKLCDWMASP